MGTKVIRFDDLTGHEGDQVTEVEGTIAETAFKLDLAPDTLDALRKALIDHDPVGLALLLPRPAQPTAVGRTDDDWVLVDGIYYQRARPHARKVKDEYSASRIAGGWAVPGGRPAPGPGPPMRERRHDGPARPQPAQGH